MAASVFLADPGPSPGPFAFLSWFPSLPVMAAITLAAAIAGIVILHLLHHGSRTVLPLVTRVKYHRWPGPGFARRRLYLRHHYGRPVARKIARRSRPSLNRRARYFGAWQEYAGFIGTAHGWIFPPRIYAHFQQLILVIAPPQKGKSAAAIGSIIDDPGPVVATSIRGDLIEGSAGLRQAMGGRVHVLNPEGAGNYGSTLTWNLVYGSQDMETAARRAGYLVEGVTARGLEDSSFWQDQASMTLAAYLHAAGLAGGSMRDVYRWILEEDPQPLHILASHPDAAEFAESLVNKYLSLPDRTRAGISTTLNAALRFMQDPQIAELLCPPGPGTLNIPQFLRSRDTLYLVVADAAQSPVPPVFTALIAEITYVARVMATVSGRLDPPLTLELDEIANTAPVPAHKWATWAAGCGIRMKIYSQAYSQLVERWKEHGAEVLWQACDIRVIYAHTAEDNLCRRVEAACGKVRVRSVRSQTHGSQGRDGNSSRTYDWTDVDAILAGQVRELPGGCAVVIQGGAKPVIVRTEKYWRRADVKAFARRDGTVALPEAPRRFVPVPDPSLLEPAPLAELQDALAGGLFPDLPMMPEFPGTGPGDVLQDLPLPDLPEALPDELSVRRARRVGGIRFAPPGTLPPDDGGPPGGYMPQAGPGSGSEQD